MGIDIRRVPGTIKGKIVLSRGEFRCTGLKCRFTARVHHPAHFESCLQAALHHVDSHQPDSRDSRVRWALEQIYRNGGEARFWPDDPVWPLLRELRDDGIVDGDFYDADGDTSTESWIRVMYPPRALYLLSGVRHTITPETWGTLAMTLVAPNAVARFDGRRLAWHEWGAIRLLMESKKGGRTMRFDGNGGVLLFPPENREGDRIADGEFHVPDVATVHLTHKGEDYWKALRDKALEARLLHGAMTAAKVIPRWLGLC